MNKKPNILFVARDDGGCGFFRCHQPADFLRRSGLADAVSVQKTPTQEQILAADLVITQDGGSVEAANMGNFMVEHGVPFMTEFDDFISHVSPNNHAGYMAWNPSTLYQYRATQLMSKGVGMTVSTNQMAREYFPYNPNIFVIPNYLNKDKWENPTVKRQDGKIRIGWCGGNAHADDLLMISKVLNKIVKEYKGQVIFETMGMTRKELTGVFPMQLGTEACPSCGYEGELHHYPGESLQDYPTVLASRGWDIAVAPVISNAFGNAKSDIKLKEYAAAGIPIVASDVTPYREAKATGMAEDTFLCRTFDDWYNALKTLIDSQERRDIATRINKEWVSKYWIQDNIEKIAQVYLQVIHSAAPLVAEKRRIL